MATPLGNSIPLTGNPLVDGLTDGSSWQLDGARLITFSLSLNDDPSGGAWTLNLANAARAAFSAWSNVANVSFQEVGSGTVFTSSSADIAATLTGSDLHRIFGNAIGIGIYPDPAAGNGLYVELPFYTRASYPRPEGDVFFDNYSPEYQYLQPGGYGLMAMIHEVGHALGLKHPFDTDENGVATFASLGIGAYDNRSYTVMSYTQSSQFATVSQGNPSTPMLLDIAAIQYIYGANMSFHTGDDTYALANGVVSTIWDAGGVDTISAAVFGFGTTINLNAGSIMTTPGTTTITAIAYNVIIENAVGSSGNDIIIGNDVDNNIDGGAGNDTMSGGNGNDTYVVNNIFDVVIETLSAGIDLIISNATTYGLPDNVENMTIGPFGIAGVGNDAANILIGNATGNTISAMGGDDFIDGRAGPDVMLGGAGEDTYIVDNGADVVAELPNNGIDTIRSSISYVLSPDVENLTLTGSGNLNGTGNSLDNVLTSNTGIDTLIGGLGNDIYFLNNAGDAVMENPGEGTDSVVAGFSFTLVGTNLENVTLTGGANLTATGNALANVLTSNTGIDTLMGGLGNDTYVLNNAAVTIVENPGEGTDTVMTSFSYSLAPGSNLENIALTGFNSRNATGDGLNNILTGSSGQNVLTGGLGNDTLIGGFALDTARFNGSMSSYTIAHTGTSGTVTGPDGADAFSSVERLQFDDQNIVFVVSKNDFNGDLASDILWRNTDGTLGIWSMQDATHYSTNILPLIPNNWHINGTGDFNGDHQSDLIWRADDGTVGIWSMQGAANYTANVLAQIPTDWQINGTGDFNGDGKIDLVWRAADGMVGIWTMQDATHYTTDVIQVIPTDWHVAGTGDFNGDGKSDVLWRADDGTVGIWSMQDAARHTTDVIQIIPTDWHVAGTGDFNGDGKSDVLWRADDGTVGIWTMQDATNHTTDIPQNIPISWAIAGTPDVNADGKNDILWRNTDGSVAVWTMQDASNHTADVPAVIPGDWLIA